MLRQVDIHGSLPFSEKGKRGECRGEREGLGEEETGEAAIRM